MVIVVGPLFGWGRGNSVNVPSVCRYHDEIQAVAEHRVVKFEQHLPESQEAVMR
jgi:hypothetical protein